MQKDIAAAGVDLAEARNQVEKLRQSVQEGHGVIEQHQQELQQIQRQIDEETQKLKGFNDELDSLKEAINGRRSDIVESELEMAQIDKDVEKAKREAKEAADKVAKRESEFEWIADECQCVGLSFPASAVSETDSALSLTGPLARRSRRTTLPASICVTPRTSAASSRRTTEP